MLACKLSGGSIKMNVLFIHSSEKVKLDLSGNLYTDGSYNKDVWDRYLYFSDKISILMRKDPKIYSSVEAEIKFNQIDQNKIDYYELPNRMQSLKTYFSLKLKKKIRTIIKEKIEKADIIIMRIPGNYYAISVAKKLEKPLIVEVVGDAFESLWHHSWKGKLLAFSARRKMRKSIKDVPYAIYVTKELLQKRYPTTGKSIDISNVIIDPVDDQILNARINKIKTNTKKIVIGTLGAIDVKYKGHKYVIEAVSILNQVSNFEFEYQVVGSGNPEMINRYIKKYNLEKRVKVLGSISHNQVSMWLDKIDLYIQPSLTEGLPRALIEAMSRALPCIASNAGGIPELIEKEYICNCSYKMGKNIAEKIYDLTNEQLIDAAISNFNKAKLYYRDNLDKRRLTFYNECLEAWRLK